MYNEIKLLQNLLIMNYCNLKNIVLTIKKQILWKLKENVIMLIILIFHNLKILYLRFKW